ncbi:MAG: M23 family metallopeptidase [candidate division Zixibacteria bacterium]|nr:M23 family metallopeptidase [candidate division Zixibacteria bacterium]
MGKAKYVTVMIVPEGTESRRGFRIRQWLLQFIIIFIACVLVGIVLFFAFYGKVLTRAAMTDRLEAENERLLRYQYKVKMLEDNLKQTRDIVGRLVKLAGIDYEFPEIPDDSTMFASLDRAAIALADRAGTQDWSFPAGLPIQGFISQGFETADEERYHPGIDIACAEGTPVLATAAGMVMYADYDSVYGYMVVLRHNDSVATIYGHNSELLVELGQKVPAGGRVALSGNTGISTAPHLHYEMRIHDEPINPLENPYDKKVNQ